MKTFGWIVVVTSAAVLVVFSGLRLADLASGGVSSDLFDSRYQENPVLSVMHILPGLVYLTLGPLQFVPAIRRRSPALHRRLGRVVAACGAIAGVSALVMAFRLPAFGGVTTVFATLLFASIFLFGIGRAVVHVRAGRVAQHREWMIRAFAIGMGVATIRLFIGLTQAFSDLPFGEVFPAAFWAGLSVNLLLAEVWINVSRERSRVAA